MFKVECLGKVWKTES